MLTDIKKKAVRSALVGLSMDELVTLSNHAGDETIVGLTNFILDNSAFASTSHRPTGRRAQAFCPQKPKDRHRVARFHYRM